MKYLVVFILFITSQIVAQNPYSLDWSDEFNGSTIDTSKWKHEIGGGGWGNNEYQYYTSSTANSFVNGGYLHIKALQQQIGTNNYTSARLITKGKYSLQYGKVEAKIKMPIGPGTWPAFWMLGDNISTVSWPACGEIDIMEHINSESKIYGTIHYDSLGHRYYGGSKACDVTNWHVYGLEWNASKLMWFLDGVKYYETPINNAARSELNNSFYFLLNVAIGGNWPGGPNQFTQFPAEMLVDFIRVYKPALAIDEVLSSSIVLVPNPADQSIQLISDLATNSFSNGNLWSMEGRFIQSVDFIAPLIDIQQLEKGAYYISFEVNGKQVVKQFLKQ